MKLSTIVEKLGGAEPESDGLLAHCPAHDDSHPSLKLRLNSEGKLLIACRSGCEFGDILTAARLFARDFFGVEDDIGIDHVTPGDEPVSEASIRGLQEYVQEAGEELGYVGAELARAYAVERFGLTVAHMDQWNLGFDDGELSRSVPILGDLYSAVPRLVVPFYDMEGELTGMQARDLTGESRAKWSGPSNPEDGGSWGKLAHFPSGSGMDYLVITEGPGDAMVSAAAGVDAVGIRGAAMAKGVLDQLTSQIGEGRRVIIAGDNDSAGKSFSEVLGNGLSGAGFSVQILEVPAKHNDLGEWFEAAREAFTPQFQQAVNNAPLFSRTVEAPKTDKAGSVKIPTTDVELAYESMRITGSRFVYSPGLGFLVYVSGAWEIDDEELQTRAALTDASEKIIKRAWLESDDEAGREKSKIVLAAGKRLQSTVTRDRVMKELRSTTRTPLQVFDQGNHLLCVGNGVVDLRDGSISSHDRDLYLTQRVAVDYKPDAECPRWDQFLREVMPGDPEGMPAFLRRLVGYGISGETVEQCFVVLWGKGANGKSVFTNTLSRVLNGIHKTTPFSTFEAHQGGGSIPSDVAALRGSRLVFASEGERGAPMAEAMIKRVTGQDEITARFLHKEFFSFRPNFLLILATNHRPEFKGQDEGLWRRVKLIPWDRYFAPEDRDHYLEETLAAEAEGILAWAIRGAQEWYAQGLGDPTTIVKATANYRDSSDGLADFFGPEAVVIPTGDPETFEKGSDIYKAYVQWANDEEMSMKDVWGRSTLYKALEERQLTRGRKGKDRGFYGVRIRSYAEMSDAPTTHDEDSVFGGAR